VADPKRLHSWSQDTHAGKVVVPRWSVLIPDCFSFRYLCRAEEERILGEFHQRVLDATSILNRAATRVQKVFRGNADRARLKAETKGKGKKKKGK